LNSTDIVHDLIEKISIEILHFIRKHELTSQDRWVSAAFIKTTLHLNFVAVPKNNKQYGQKGWFFAIIARLLEDRGLLEYKKTDGKAYYRTIH